MLQGVVPQGIDHISQLRVHLSAQDPVQDETIARPAWEVYAYVEDSTPIPAQAMELAMQQAAMRVPALADHFHEAGNVTSGQEVNQLLGNFVRAINMPPESVQLLQDWFTHQASDSMNLEHSVQNEHVFMRTKSDIPLENLYKNLSGKEPDILAAIQAQAAVLRDEAGQPVFTPQELMQLSHEYLEVRLPEGTSKQAPSVVVALANEDYAQYGEDKLQYTSVLAKLPQDVRESMLRDALAVHSDVAYPLLATPQQVHQDIAYIAEQHGVDANALLGVSQLQALDAGSQPLPTLGTHEHASDGYTTMNMTFTLPYGTQLDGVLQNIIENGHQQEMVLGARRVTEMRANVLETLLHHPPDTVIDADGMQYDMAIMQKQVEPVLVRQ